MKKRIKTGLSPGSIVFTGKKKVDKVLMHFLQYDADNLLEESLDNHRKIVFNKLSPTKVDWYDFRGLHDTDLIEFIGNTFAIHPLVLEDIVDIHQRPKYDEYDEGIFVTMRSLSFDFTKTKVETEQIAIYFNKKLLVSFQETDSDLFEPVRKRVKHGQGRVRNRNADYLCYALMDNIVDNYFLVLDAIEEEIEALEGSLLENPGVKVKQRIHKLKKELLVMRKAISPLREAISQFSKSENEHIDDRTALFVRDLYDHTVQIMDIVDTLRDTLNGLQDLYLSEISFRMNQVMQVLAVITTIFVPITFLAGLYGMNFDNIPELHHQNGYYILLFVMLCIFTGSLYYFKRRKWF